MDSSLDDLDSLISHLTANTLPHTLLALDTIQQAKLQSLIPYTLYDLVFIYLKSNGVDPKSHPVVSELDRVRQYFEKIASAENSPQRRLLLDKAAAGRFLKHALAHSHQNPGSSSSPSAPSPPAPSAPPTIPIPVKITPKMIARAQYQQALRDSAAAGDDQEPDLQVWDDAPPPDPENGTSDNLAQQVSSDSRAGIKRRRPPIDPFAASGYGDDLDEKSASDKADSATATTSVKKPKKKLRK